MWQISRKNESEFATTEQMTNVIREMNKNVEFQFVELLYCPASWTEQEVLDFMFKEFLFNEE